MYIFKVLYIILLLFTLMLKNSNAANENENILTTNLNTTISTDTQTTPYIINRTLNGETFTINIPPSIIKIYESNSQKPIIPINDLFSDPLQLLLLNELTKKTIAVFEKVGLQYWACFSTLESIKKFTSFAPWDCYTYLAVDITQLKEKLPELNEHMQETGIFFNPSKNIASKKFSFFVKFEPETFASIVKNYEPAFTTEKIDELYTTISSDFIAPKVEIITFTISDSGIKYYIDFFNKTYLTKDQIKSGYNYNHIFPLINHKLNNFEIKIPYLSEKIMHEALFKGNFFQLSILANSTKFNALNIENLYCHADFLVLIKNYLSFVFKDQFLNVSGAYQKIIKSI